MIIIVRVSKKPRAVHTLQLLRDFENRSIRKADFDLTEATVQFHGQGTISNPQVLELAGRDFGPSMAGFADNFAFGTLKIESGTVLELADLFDNGNRYGGKAEALYVGDLFLGTGATLDCAGLNLYYVNLTDNGGIITDGTPIFVPEPATLALILSGFLVLAGQARRRAAPARTVRPHRGQRLTSRT